MTVTTNDGFKQTTATGGETTIDFDFLIESASDIEVLRTPAAGGAPITLALTTDYTVPSGSIGLPAGGTINLTSGSFPTGAAAGDKFTCRSNFSATRSTDFNQLGDFTANELNDQLDRLTILVQQILRDLDRAARLPDDSTSTSLVLPAPEDDKVLAWNGTSGAMKNGPTSAAISGAAANATAAAASASTATTQAGIATTQAGIATAAAASVSLPTLGAADTVLQVNAGGTALEYASINFYNLDTGILASEAEAEAGTATDALMTPERTAQAIAALQDKIEFGSWLFPTVQDQDYKLIIKAPYGGTITNVITQSVSGTCTMTVKINTIALGGTANSVSSSESDQSHSTSNVFAAGDDISVTVASNSSCLRTSLTIVWTRA